MAGQGKQFSIEALHMEMMDAKRLAERDQIILELHQALVSRDGEIESLRAKVSQLEGMIPAPKEPPTDRNTKSE